MNVAMAGQWSDPLRAISVGNNTIVASATVRSLSVILDFRLDDSTHNSAVIKAWNFHLRQIARVRHYLTQKACSVAVLALVVPRLDYCNGVMGTATNSKLRLLQRIQNRAARFVLRPRAPRGVVLHVAPHLQQFHWLPV